MEDTTALRQEAEIHDDPPGSAPDGSTHLAESGKPERQPRYRPVHKPPGTAAETPEEIDDIQPSRPLLVRAVALATLGSGLINLYSLIGPDLPERVQLLREVFPLEFLHLSRFLTLLVGFALVISSVNIYLRKKRAWQSGVALSCLSIIFHMTKGLDYEEALCSLALLLFLVATRRRFTVRSGAPEWRWEMLRLGLAFCVVIAYAVGGFWLLDRRQFGIDFTLRDSIHRTFLFLSMAGDPSLIPHTRYAQWFLDSLYLSTITAIGYAGLALFRPALFEFSTLPHERAMAADLVNRYGRSALDYFKTWPDKSFFFSPSRQAFLAYGVSGNFALVLGDPVGKPDEIEGLIRSFAALCHENGWTLGFHGVLPELLPVYHRLGFRKLKIGDDAIVDLTQFNVGGKSRKDLRSKLNQMEKQGYQTVAYEPPLSDTVVAEVKSISDEWLEIPGRRERRFTLGMYEPHYVRSMPLYAVHDPDGRMLAFMNLIPSYTPGECTVDLMRRRNQAPNGVMDYLFTKTMLGMKEKGYARFSLGMAPMAGFQEREEASREEKAVHLFFKHLNFVFSFRGLYLYKAKFATIWEPRYAIYRKAVDLPRLAVALSRLSEIKDLRKDD
jgi:phosphatidylglycerol lysyltransferase